MAQKKFKSESKRLLDMMINSIYTHKEIFLRELISNASDATDKLYYMSLKDENIDFNRDNFYIRISADKEHRILTISDNGIGMDEHELDENLGTIAKSGSLAFKNSNETKDDVDIIGQFGVGFYSAFMVADCVTVVTKKYGSEQAYRWMSKGVDGYEITPCEKESSGTEITLSIKPDTEDEKYSEYLDEYKLRSLVKKYSDYIKYPIKMMTTHSRKKEDSDDYETYQEDETLNSMVPLWKKSKSEISKEQYNNFYREKFFDYEEPARVIHATADGIVSYTALMFIPKHVPFDYYTKEYEKGLALYSNGVLIMDKCADLLPDYFGFVKGLVDSADLSLNISREMLQHDRQLRAIAANIKKKIKSELLNMLKNDRSAYEDFYKAFSRQLKFGVYDNYGADKDFLQDLIMFTSSKDKKLVTLAEYTEHMPEGQDAIYYATGESAEKIDKLPQVEAVKDKYEVLYLTEDVDEFAIKVMGKFADKEFKSVSDSEFDLGESEKEAQTKADEENKDLMEEIKKVLDGKITEAKASVRLKSHPVCITTTGGVSVEMEKVLSQMPSEQKVEAKKVLEINANHPVMTTLKNLLNTNKEKFDKYVKILYSSALLIEGLTVEDPIEFSNNLCDLID